MKRYLFLACVLSVTVLIQPSARAITIPDLGDATDFALLAIPNESDTPSISISSSSTVSGNLGIGPSGVYIKSGSGNVIGNVLLSSGDAKLITGSGSPGTLLLNSNLSQAIADALQASSDAAALSPTQVLGNITTSQTLTSSGNVNVVSLTSINLSGSKTLTLSGSATDAFIVNISGGFGLSGSSAIALSGGLTPNHVLFNLPTSGTSIVFFADEVGTLLAPHRDFTLHGASLLGAVLANDIQVTSGGQVSQESWFDAPPTPNPTPTIPEPHSAILLGLGLVGFLFLKPQQHVAS